LGNFNAESCVPGASLATRDGDRMMVFAQTHA